jgi:hypothetical protein
VLKAYKLCKCALKVGNLCQNLRKCVYCFLCSAIQLQDQSNGKPTLLVHCLCQMLPLNHKKTTSSLVPPIIRVAKKRTIKRYKVLHCCAIQIFVERSTYKSGAQLLLRNILDSFAAILYAAQHSRGYFQKARLIRPRIQKLKCVWRESIIVVMKFKDVIREHDKCPLSNRYHIGLVHKIDLPSISSTLNTQIFRTKVRSKPKCN